LALPIGFLFSGVFAVEFTLSEFAIHVGPYALSVLLTHRFVQRWYTCPSERRIPWRSMVLEKATWHVYLMGMLSALLKRPVHYLPTPKGSDRMPAARLVLPHIAAILLSALAIGFALVTYPRLDDGTLLMISFAALNMALLCPVTFIALFPRWNWRAT
jgi:hypothetical protein